MAEISNAEETIAELETQSCDHVTKRSTEYTTENYKMELSNLPFKTNFHVVKNILERNFKLVPHKIKLGQGKAYITFRSENELDAAISTLNHHDWKGRTLSARRATPRDDISSKKRKHTDTDRLVISDEFSAEEGVNDRVCPFWNTEYEKQIEFKDQLMRSVLNMGKQIMKLSPTLETDDPRLFEWIKNNGKISCQFDGVMKSPVLRGYRNKCEFNIDHSGEIGFMVGRYRNGSDRIHQPPKNCPILCPKMYEIIDKFRSYIKERTHLKGFDPVTHEGCFRQLTIKRNQNEDYLLIVDMHPQDLSEDEIDAEVKKITDELKSIEGVISIYFNISARSSHSKQSLRLVFGQVGLIEQLHVNPERPLKFRIGPTSFFQVNTKAAEILYRSIIDLAQLSSNSFVLDVGCGTGTIGLSLAHKVNHVIGIEIVPEAIEDAKVNAKENGIDNVSFYAGKAEDLIAESLKILSNKMDFQKIDDGEIIAIVDPPRVGFNNSFIKTLRASNVKKLIYVACDPKANTNLLTLCRPRSKAYQGNPFVPVRAQAFDLFPYTKFCELVIVYQRISMVKSGS